MKQYRVAILGASGAVGQEMMKILAERSFPIGELHLLASARSAGKVVSWQGQDIVVEEATDAAFAGMDIVLGAAQNEVDALRDGKAYAPKVFAHQIAYNVIPQIGGEQCDGYTSEEMKLQNEGRKILHLPDMNVSCTCVRVPVVRSHSISAAVHFAHHISVDEARAAIAAAPGCRLVDDLDALQYPMPLDTSDQDLVFVGRIRPDLTDPNGLCLWCCGDQVRKGAATNCVQIAELLIQNA